MSYMFHDNYVFNQPIGNWNVSNVTNMEYMFGTVILWRKILISLSVIRDAKVTNMNHMFDDCEFNQDISKWIVSNVTAMNGMFCGATYSINLMIGMCLM